MEPISTLEGDTHPTKLEAKEIVPAEKEVVKETEGKRVKGGLRFSLSTERRYDEKSISEEELKKKRERLMHRRGTQYEYLIDGKIEKSKDEEKSKSVEDVLPKDQISAPTNDKLPDAEIQISKDDSKQIEKEEKELEMIEKKVAADVTIE